MIWQPGRTLDDVEKDVICAALQFYQNNKTNTARALGIAIRTLDYKLERYNGSASLRPEAGSNVESFDQADTQERPVPLPERKEVQKLSPSGSTQSHSPDNRRPSGNAKKG